MTELRFYGEYEVAQILQRAYADYSGLCTPMALCQVAVERMTRSAEKKDIRLYIETRQDLRETIGCLSSHSQDVAIVWNHGLRRDVSYSAFTSDMKAMSSSSPDDWCGAFMEPNDLECGSCMSITWLADYHRYCSNVLPKTLTRQLAYI